MDGWTDVFPSHSIIGKSKVQLTELINALASVHQFPHFQHLNYGYQGAREVPMRPLSLLPHTQISELVEPTQPKLALKCEEIGFGIWKAAMGLQGSDKNEMVTMISISS